MDMDILANFQVHDPSPTAAVESGKRSVILAVSQEIILNWLYTKIVFFLFHFQKKREKKLLS